MRLLNRLFLFLLGAAVVGTGAFFAIGPARIWDRLAGPADLGPVDFATLRRRTVPNDALACSRGACPAPAEIELPLFARPPGELLARLEEQVAREGDGNRVDDGSDPLYRRYVLRTPVLRFPDTLDIRARPGPEGTALLLYSRSALGRGDFGTNRARLERLLAPLRPAALPAD